MMAAEQQQRCGLAQSADPQPSKWGRRRQQRQHAASALKALAACDQSAVSRLGVSGRCIAAAWRTPALKQPDAIKNGLSLVSPDLTLWAALLPPAPAVIQQGAEAKRANRRLT